MEDRSLNILWDFDGTIFDTYPAYTKILQEILGENIPATEIFSMLKISFTHAIQHYQLSQEQEKQIRERSNNIQAESLKPFPYVEKVLQVSNTNVIMTHKNRKEVEAILSIHGLSSYFIEIVAGDDGFPRKPHSASYQYLQGKYDLDLAIGDRELDIIPAREIGIKTCLFQNNTPGADYYLNDYVDFFDVVPSC